MHWYCIKKIRYSIYLRMIGSYYSPNQTTLLPKNVKPRRLIKTVHSMLPKEFKPESLTIAIYSVSPKEALIDQEDVQ